jgi:hypothetical protein
LSRAGRTGGDEAALLLQRAGGHAGNGGVELEHGDGLMLPDERRGAGCAIGDGVDG